MALNRYVLTATVTVPAGSPATVAAGEPGTGGAAGFGTAGISAGYGAFPSDVRAWYADQARQRLPALHVPERPGRAAAVCAGH